MIRSFQNNDLDRVNALFLENDMPVLSLENLSSYSRLVVYVEEEYIVGVMLYQHIYDRMELDEIVVDKTFRKKGIGKYLMQYLIEEAVQLGCINITLEVCEENKVAISLYEQFGFIKVAVRPNYYASLDGYLMMREM